MKDLLNHIKSKLKKDLNYIELITIIPHELLIPLKAGFPQIGLLDSGDKIEKGKHQGLQKLTVSIAAYQKVLEGREESIIGGQSEKGVLEITEDIKTSLKSELFEGSYNLVKYLGSAAIRAFTADYEDFIAFKICKFEYHRSLINI